MLLIYCFLFQLAAFLGDVRLSGQENELLELPELEYVMYMSASSTKFPTADVLSLRESDFFPLLVLPLSS